MISLSFSPSLKKAKVDGENFQGPQSCASPFWLFNSAEEMEGRTQEGSPSLPNGWVLKGERINYKEYIKKDRPGFSL
jgi:hypothetical protein